MTHDQDPHFDPETFFERILTPLLSPDDGTMLQVVYVKMKDGSKHPLIGAPMPEKDWQQIEQLEEGEVVQIDLHDHEGEEEDSEADNEDGKSEPGARTTAH